MRLDTSSLDLPFSSRFDLKKRDLETLYFILEYQRENLTPPTYREIVEALDLVSTEQVLRTIRRLRERGLALPPEGRELKSRNIRLSPMVREYENTIRYELNEIRRLEAELEEQRRAETEYDSPTGDI